MSNTTPRLDIVDGEVWCAICGGDLVEGVCPPCDEVFKDAPPPPEDVRIIDGIPHTRVWLREVDEDGEQMSAWKAMEEADPGGWDAFEGEDQDD